VLIPSLFQTLPPPLHRRNHGHTRHHTLDNTFDNTFDNTSDIAADIAADIASDIAFDPTTPWTSPPTSPPASPSTSPPDITDIAFNIASNIASDIASNIASDIASNTSDMRALSSANFLQNDIGIDQAQALVSILKEHPTLKSLCGNKGDEAELDMSCKMKGAADAIMLVPEIIDNGALTSLNISSNAIGGHWSNQQQRMFVTPEGIFGIFVAATFVPHFVFFYVGPAAIADAIKNMRAMWSFTFGERQAVTMTTTMTEMDFSGKGLGVSEAIMISAFLPKCT
jgi:hypothetical protein